MTQKEVKNSGYLGNPNLKPVGIEIDFTEDQIKEYVKCANDPVYFIEKYIKVVSLDKGLVPFDLYDYQEEIVNTIHDNRFIIAKLPRQSGKSTTVISYILHYVLFNQSMNVAVLANKQSTAREILSRLKLAYEYLPKWLQQGIIEWNKGSIHLENGSKIIASATSSSAIRGGSFNLIFLDEFAHVPQNIAEEFFSSVYPTITSGQSTKVLMVSTPNGLNMFYTFWRGATRPENDPQKSEYVPIEVHWTQVPLYSGGPLRDEKWKLETIRNSSEQQFQSEFECDFVGSSNTLISTAKLKQMFPSRPKTKTAEGYREYYEPQEDHTYFITVDVSRGQAKDNSAFTIVDATEFPYKIAATFYNNTISPLVYPTIIDNVSKRYNDAWILVEINDIGGQVADILHHDLENEFILSVTSRGRSGQVLSGGFSGVGQTSLGVKTTQPIKKIGCSVLRSLIEEDKMLIEDENLIMELTSFISKRNTYEADDGHNDDLTMSLVLFSWMTRQPYYKELAESDVRKGIYKQQIADIEESYLPFGFINDGSDESGGEWDGDDRWYLNSK
tara:strand:- start:47694 stop:49364 length:1671 start_codon:yes stop_codon:yes gene_type:complete